MASRFQYLKNRIADFGLLLHGRRFPGRSCAAATSGRMATKIAKLTAKATRASVQDLRRRDRSSNLVGRAADAESVGTRSTEIAGAWYRLVQTNEKSRLPLQKHNIKKRQTISPLAAVTMLCCGAPGAAEPSKS